MADKTTLTQGLLDGISHITPDGMSELTHEQQVEVTKFLVDKVVASDELLGSVTRKVRQLKEQGKAKPETAPGAGKKK